jgi:uncharacterized protein YggU (UPF0235/DUF167 family)
MTEPRIVRVEVRTGMKKETVLERGDVLLISVREEAERNMANARVRELIARRFGVPPKRVRIITGHRTPKKMLQVLE